MVWFMGIGWFFTVGFMVWGGLRRALDANDMATSALRSTSRTHLEELRLATSRVGTARWVVERNDNPEDAGELLEALRRAEGDLVTRALEIFDAGLSYEEALIVAKAGRLVARRGGATFYRWLKTEHGGAWQVRANLGDPGDLNSGACWVAWEPSEEDRAATDWVRRTATTSSYEQLLTSYSAPRHGMVS